MQCPQLSELPRAPAGKTGWPWTEESRRLSARGYAAGHWPRISVITPSFNQGEFIEETIRSVLLQGYPDLEYLILDGGSTDHSVEIIKKYSTWLGYWISEPDSGQSDAINRGLKRASGDFGTWINSDDMFCRNALADHATRIGFDTNIVYVGICVYIDETGKTLSAHRGRVHSLEDLVDIRNVWRSGGQIVQPEVLFPLDMALAKGGLDTDNHFTMDYEFWGKLFLAGAKFQYTEIPFGMFRQHGEQKTHDPVRTTESLLKTAAELIKVAECFSEAEKTGLIADLDAYNTEYGKAYWKGTGRLARIGLSPGFVIWLRGLKTVLQKNPKGPPTIRSSSYIATRVR
jgi:glycosyltransferase involved in cell wall biosynthesis